MPHDSPAPFVVGAPRSGTTLLRLMLDAHPQIAIPAESHFYPALLAVDERRDDWLDAALAAITGSHTWGDYRLDGRAFERAVRDADPSGIGDVLRTFYRTYAARFGKRRWGDKFPGNVLHMAAIARHLPEARFVHIVRDGRDVAASLRGRWWRPDGDTYPACIELWAGRIRAAREQAAGGIPYLEVRYEALVREPRATLARVCDFAEIPYDDAMLGYAERARSRHDEVSDWHFEGRFIPRAQLVAVHANTQRPLTQETIGRWRGEMSAADAAACERVAGDVLRELGYR
ncbi:MAG TPA: sulfotransferase [Candidatus Elarobacter sp.]|jgi:hypothetical protein